MDVNAIKNNLAGMAGSSAPEYTPREVEEEKGILDSMTDYVKGTAEWVADSAVGQAVGGVVNAAWEDTRDALTATSWNDMQEAANRHNISNTVNSIANDNSSVLQPLAQAVQQSPVVYNYLMDNSGKLVQARTIQREIGIPADVTMADSASWKRANELYQENLEYKKLAEDNGTQWTLDNLYAKHPEIKNIADKDPAAGALVLKDMPSVRKEMDIIDGFTQFLNMGNKELELNNLRFKSYGNVLDDNDRQRMQDLEKQLDIEKQLYDVKFRNDPLMFALSGVGQSLPEMWQSIRTGAEDAAAWSAAATWAGAGTGAAVGAVAGPAGAAAGATAGGIIGAAAAAVKGTIKAVTAHEARKAILSQVATRAAAKATAPQLMKNGMTFGALRGMAAPETGSRYDEYRNLRDAQGNRLLTDEEAWRDALLGGTVNAALETVPTFGVLGKIAKPGTQGARIIEDIVTRNMAKTQLGTDIQKGARKLFSNTLKVTGTESFEEGAQQAADDIIMNSIKASHGGRVYTEKYGVLYDQGKAMTASEILADSATAAIEAIPSSMAFGLTGAVGGGAASGGRYAIRQRHLLKNETDAERMARHTYTGAVMAEQLQEAVHSSELQKTAPDVQAQLIKEKATGTGFEIMYIDTEMALQKENGQQDLEALAKAAGIDEEALQMAVDTKGTIAVSLESFAQSEASSELLDSASFDTEADSMARMRENAKYTMEKMRENAEKLVEHQINLVQTIPKELYPEDTPEAELNRQLIEAAIITDIDNPIRGLNQLIQEAEADKLTILQPALDFLADTSGKGVSIVDIGDGRTIRVSENAQWYQEFYKEHKRKPTKQEFMDIASDMVSGKSNIEFWAVTDAEGEAAANEIASELEKANRKLEVLNGVKEKMKGINGTEMKIAESMTTDAYKVYRKYMDLLKNAPGLASRAARVNAVMFAHMMERLAENTRRATGNQKYTAMDAADKVMLQMDGMQQGNALKFSFNQMAGANARNAATGKLSQAKKMHEVGDTESEIYEKTGWLKGKDGKWRFEIADDLESIELENIDKGYTVGLGEIYRNEKLFEAYPELSDVDVCFETMPDDTWGWVNEWHDTITINEKLLNTTDGIQTAKLTLVHEIQHVIQAKEGFAQGGNPENAIRDIEYEIEYIDNTLAGKNQPKEKERQELLHRKNELKKTLAEIETAEDKEEAKERAYYRLAGEYEARYVSNRALVRLVANYKKRPTSDGLCLSDAIVIFGAEQYDFNNFPDEYYNQGIQGQTAIATNGSYILSLFEKADESTFMHEMAHVYLLELEKLAVLDKQCRADFDTVMEWAAYKNGDEKHYKGSPFAKEFKTLAGNIRAAEDAGDVDTADRLKRQWAHERFARGFEMYLEHGTAPSKALQSAFRKFKQFLKTLYIAFAGEGVRANAKVEKVMARMLASDEEIEAMALDDRYKDISKAGGEKLLQETQKETYQRWYSEAQEEAKERLMKIMMADLEEENQRKHDAAMAVERAKKEAELEDLPLYIAQKIIQESGDENTIVELGIYPTVEQYKSDLAEYGSMETVLGDYMAWYAESLDRQKIQTHTTEEQLAKMMEQTVYHKKLMAFEAEAMREKEKMVNKINSKAKNAIDELSTTIDNLPEGVDVQVDFKSEAVKKLISAVNKLRFSTRWTAQEIAEIDNILKQATPEDMKKALDNFSKEATSWKKNLKTIEEAFKGRMNIIRDMTRKDLAKRSIAEACDQGKYQAAEKRAAELMHRMIRASKWDVAMVQQEARFTSAAMAEAAEKNRDKVNRTLERVKKQLTAKTVKLPAEERYWIRKLAHDLKLDKNWQKDMGRPTSEGVRLVPDEPARPEECRELSQIFDELKNSLEIQGDMLEALSAVYQPGFTDYRALTISQLEACANIITVLYKTGKDKFQLKSFDGKLLSDVVDEIVLDVDAAGNVLNMPQVKQKKVNDDAGGIGYNDFLAKIPGLGPTLSEYGAKYLSAHMKPEELIRLLGNAAHRYLYNLYDRAAGENGKRTAEAIQKLQEIMSVYSRKEKQDFRKQQYELRTGAGVERLSKENVICMALNMGTDTNFIRLYKGLGVTWEAAQAFVEENMTKRDWETVQAIWDYIGSFWPETVKVEEELNGVTLEGVEAKEFTVMCEGKPLKMKGGYYPIAYNPVKSTKAETQTMDAMTQRNMSGAQVLGTGRGFTKARSETENIERPLLLQFNVIPNHLQEVIQNITFRIAARDAYRLTHSLNFEEHVRSTLGNEALKSINQWVVDCWRIMPTDTDQGTSLFSRSLGFLRRNATINIMGYRLWPVVENVTNLFPMMDRIGAVNAISALGDYMAHRQENDKLLLKSIFMTNRINSMDRDIGMTPGIFKAGYKATDWLREHAYSALIFTDLMFSKPLWCRTYKDAFAKNFQKVMEEEQLKKLQLEDAQETVEALKADIAPYSRELYMLKNSLREGGEYELEAGPGDYESISGKHERIAYLEKYLKPLRQELWKAEVELDRLSNLSVKSQGDIVTEAEKRSAQAADEAVRSVFGSGQTKDLAAVQKGGEFLKLFTAFYSFFNTQANAILAAYYKGKFQRDELAGATGLRRWMPFAKAVFYRIILTSAMSTVMKMVLLGDGDDDKHKYRKVKNADGTEIDEEIPALERFMVQFAKNTVSTASGTAVGLRDIVGLYTNLIFEGTDYGRGASIGSVGMGVVDKLTKTFKLASKQEEKNAKIEEQELRRQARYDKMTPAAKKKFDEDLKYRKPVHRITYADIGKSLTQAATSVTAGRTGITDSIANTVMTTLQYMADGDGCYDKTLSNMAWSAIWNKKPVAREVPKKPPEEKKKKKTKEAR